MTCFESQTDFADYKFWVFEILFSVTRLLVKLRTPDLYAYVTRQVYAQDDLLNAFQSDSHPAVVFSVYVILHQFTAQYSAKY